MSFRQVVVYFATLAGLFAQSPYGRVSGRIVDSADAVVPGANVRVINIGTGVVIKVARDSQGNYDSRNLLPGLYRILVEMQGFKRYQQQPIEVRVGDVLHIDIP